MIAAVPRSRAPARRELSRSIPIAIAPRKSWTSSKRHDHGNEVTASRPADRQAHRRDNSDTSASYTGFYRLSRTWEFGRSSSYVNIIGWMAQRAHSAAPGAGLSASD